MENILLRTKKLPYPKLQKIVKEGGIKFKETPRRIDLELAVEEIDEQLLTKLYEKYYK